MRSIFFTGGTGFFGRAVLRNWERKFAHGVAVPSVTVLTRNPKRFTLQFPEFKNCPWLSFWCGDVLEPNSYPPSANFSHILHAAAESTIGPSLSPLTKYHLIVDGTKYLLDYAVKNRVGKFLFVSSGAVYGAQPQNRRKITESSIGSFDHTDPRNAYGQGKRTAEFLCSAYQAEFGIEVVVARCFSFIGQDLPLNAHFAIGNFIVDAIEKRDIVVKGDGTSLRSYMDQDDLSNWLTEILRYGKAGESYNVGSDTSISIRDLAYKVRNLLSPKSSVRILGDRSMLNNRSSYIPDISKARDHLGLTANTSLDNSIIKCANAHIKSRSPPKSE